MKSKIVLFIFFYLILFNSTVFSSEVLDYEILKDFCKNSKWLSSSLNSKQKETIFGFIAYGLQKRARGELEHVNMDRNNLPSTGFSVRYDYSTMKALETIHEASCLKKSEDFKVADFGSGLGYFTALIPCAVEPKKKFTLCYLDGVRKNVEATNGAIKYLKDQNLYEKMDVKFMTSLVQKLDSTNYLGKQVNNFIDVIICLNVIHFLSEKEKLLTLKSINRLLKPGGTAILTFSPFLINNKKLLNTECAITHSRFLAEYMIFRDEEGELNTTGLESDIIPIPPHSDEDFYTQQRFYINHDNIWESLDLNSLQDLTKNIKGDAKFIFYRYVEKTTRQDITNFLISAGFQVENIKIEEYQFDDPKRTEFEKFKILASLKIGDKSIYAQVKK